MSQKTFDLLAEAAETAFNAEPNHLTLQPALLNLSLTKLLKFKDGLFCSHDTNVKLMVKQMVTGMMNQKSSN